MMKYLPNIITLLRIIFLVPYVYYLHMGHTKLALAIFLVAGFTDCLDGFLARYYSWTSKLGAILDPFADKLLMVSSFITLFLIGSINLFALLVLIFRDLFIILGVVSVYYFAPKVLKFEPVYMSKVNTVLQLFLIFCLLLNLSYLSIPANFIYILVGIVMATSFISLLQYIKLVSTWLSSSTNE